MKASANHMPEHKHRHCTDRELLEDVLCKLDHLSDLAHRVLGGTLTNIEKEVESMNQAMTRLEQEVSETRTAMQGATTLLRGLGAQIRALEPTRAALNTFADNLNTDTNALAAAVIENTVAAQEPPVDPNQPIP